MNQTLPEGWATTTLGDLSTYVTSGSRDWSKYYADHGALFVRTQDINQNTLAPTDNIARVALPQRVEGKRTLIAQGDLLITITGANVGKCALVDIPIPEAYVSQSVALVRLANGFSGRFIQRQLTSPSSGDDRTLLQQSAYGVGRPVLNLDNVRELPICLAPLNEQTCIIAAINDLLSSVNSARDHLSRVPVILKRFRQAVLAAACSGGLTEDWRKSHQDTESARSLLDRILAERLARFKEEPKAVPRGKHPDQNDLKERQLDAGSLPDVPDSWTWVTWDDLTDWITYGFTRPMPHLPNGVPIVTAKNVLDARVDFSSADFTSKRAFAELSDKDRPLRGEILLTKDGSIGRAAIVDTDEPFCINQSVAVLRFGGLTAHVPYLLRVIQSPFTQGLIREGAGGTAIPHISITTFGTFAVPLPPLEEQIEIARIVDGLFRLAEGIEVGLAKARARADRLIQAILAEAFRGELVPTEAELARREGREYEPASVLLDRIRQQRERHAKEMRNAKHQPRRSKARVKTRKEQAAKC